MKLLLYINEVNYQLGLLADPIGILLTGTELLDSQVKMAFSTGTFHVDVVFNQLTMEFSSDCSVKQVTSVTSQQL